MKFSAGDPNLLGVLSQRNFLQMFGIVQPQVGAAGQSRLEQRDFIKVSKLTGNLNSHFSCSGLDLSYYEALNGNTGAGEGRVTAHWASEYPS